MTSQLPQQPPSTSCDLYSGLSGSTGPLQIDPRIVRPNCDLKGRADVRNPAHHSLGVSAELPGLVRPATMRPALAHPGGRKPRESRGGWGFLGMSPAPLTSG